MLYVDGIAALWFSRHNREKVPWLERCDFLKPPKRVSEISYRGLAVNGLADKPLRLAVHDASERICASAFSYRVFPKGLPRGAFMRLGNEVAIATPQLCFAELSRALSVPELILLGFELGGSYALVPKDDSGFTSKQPVLCSADDLRDFIHSMPRTPGLARAKEALRWISGPSASPRETQLGLRLRLPTRLGGYKMDGFEHNGEVKIRQAHAKRIGVESFHCDLLFRRENIGVEYQSNDHHLDKRSYARDMQRMNAIQAAGTRIINVTNEQLSNYQEFDLLARELSAALHRRFRKPMPGQFARKLDLIEALERAEDVVKKLDSRDGESGRWLFEEVAKSRGNFSPENWLEDYLLGTAPGNAVQ